MFCKIHISNTIWRFLWWSLANLTHFTKFHCILSYVKTIVAPYHAVMLSSSFHYFCMIQDQQVHCSFLQKEVVCWLSHWLLFSETLLWTCSTEDHAKRLVCAWVFLLQNTRNLTVKVLMNKLLPLQLLYLLAVLLKHFSSWPHCNCALHTFFQQLYRKLIEHFLTSCGG